MKQQIDDAQAQTHRNPETEPSPAARETFVSLDVEVMINGLADHDFPFSLALGFVTGPFSTKMFNENTQTNRYMVDNPFDISSVNIITNDNASHAIPYPPQAVPTPVNFPSGVVYVSLGVTEGRFLRVIVSTAHIGG